MISPTLTRRINMTLVLAAVSLLGWLMLVGTGGIALADDTGQPPAGTKVTPHHIGRTNHLAHESSPYLLQHATNPVDWYPPGQFSRVENSTARFPPGTDIHVTLHLLSGLVPIQPLDTLQPQFVGQFNFLGNALFVFFRGGHPQKSRGARNRSQFSAQ